MRFALAALLLAAPAAADAPPLPHAFDAGWQGRKTCEPLFENERMRAGRCTFPPGIGHERHFHRAHWVYVLSGATMRMTDANGTRETTLKAGDSYWNDGIAWHEGVNIGETTAIYVIIEPKQP